MDFIVFRSGFDQEHMLLIDIRGWTRHENVTFKLFICLIMLRK